MLLIQKRKTLRAKVWKICRCLSKKKRRGTCLLGVHVLVNTNESLSRLLAVPTVYFLGLNATVAGIYVDKSQTSVIQQVFPLCSSQHCSQYLAALLFHLTVSLTVQYVNYNTILFVNSWANQTHNSLYCLIGCMSVQLRARLYFTDILHWKVSSYLIVKAKHFLNFVLKE